MSSSSRPLAIALVAASLRILGGQAVQAQRLIDHWRGDADARVWLVPIDPVPPAPFDRLQRIKYVRTLVTQLWYWPSLVRELRRADLVHVFSASYASFLLAPLPAVLVATALGKPVILHYHSGEAPDHLRRSAIARGVLRRTTLNVVPSLFLREVFARFGLSSRVVANTIDLTTFAYREREPLRPRLLSTRNFEPLYNVACTLRAFAIVQQRHPDATLTLVGFGSQEAALRSLAAQLHLRSVTFVGRVPPDAMAGHYASADVYVQTPSIDNMPNSIIEAFASGLPVVSTGVGGVPTILTHGVHGLLAPPDDHLAVAGHVLTLLDRPAYARQMARAAHDSCRAYQWTLVRDAWLQVYRAAAGRRPDATLQAAPT